MSRISRRGWEAGDQLLRLRGGLLGGIDLGLVGGEITRAKRRIGGREVLGGLVEQGLDLLLDRTLRRLRRPLAVRRWWRHGSGH
jgi:hypothetical protein